MKFDLQQRVNDLNDHIQNGKIMEAMRKFYSDDVVMAENNSPPTIGLQANLEREQAFVDNTTWYGLELKGVALGENLSTVIWDMDFHNIQYGARLAFTQVAVQQWREGKIVDERFYYSPQPVNA